MRAGYYLRFCLCQTRRDIAEVERVHKKIKQIVKVIESVFYEERCELVQHGKQTTEKRYNRGTTNSTLPKNRFLV